jgi:Flp pilus assembly protein TadG
VREEKGAVVVEVAMMLPLLVLLLLGALDFGIMVHRHQVLQNAAREGARYSAQHRIGDHSVTATTIQNIVVDYCAEQNVTIATSDVTVTQDHPFLVGGTTVQASRITVTHAHALMTPGMSDLLGSPLNLSAQGIFRNLY